MPASNASWKWHLALTFTLLPGDFQLLLFKAVCGHLSLKLRCINSKTDFWRLVVQEVGHLSPKVATWHWKFNGLVYQWCVPTIFSCTLWLPHGLQERSKLAAEAEEEKAKHGVTLRRLEEVEDQLEGMNAVLLARDKEMEQLKSRHLKVWFRF